MHLIARRHTVQSGFTLIEVLVTLVIFAFGMLGVAGLQLVSLSNMDSAQYRSIASLKASEMAERLRANSGTNYIGVSGQDKACRSSHYSDSHVAVACTPSELAADDLHDWGSELEGRLPSGVGVVCKDSTPEDGIPGAPACDDFGTAMTIKVFWTEKPKTAAAATPKRLTVSVEG